MIKILYSIQTSDDLPMNYGLLVFNKIKTVEVTSSNLTSIGMNEVQIKFVIFFQKNEG